MSGYLAAIDKIAKRVVANASAPNTDRKQRPPQSQVRLMQSNGGIVSASSAASEPVRTILSGPAGGILGAEYIASLAGYEKVISFDMGGTSTDVALLDGPARTTNESVVDDLPVSVPMLDIHTVGAGGGSIARIDQGGALRVGPESAGADPGPAAYGKGNQPTVTDAHLILGRLGGATLLGGEFQLDADKARQAVNRARKKSPSLSTARRIRPRHNRRSRSHHGPRDPRNLSRAWPRPTRLFPSSLRRRRLSTRLRPSRRARNPQSNHPQNPRRPISPRHPTRRHSQRFLANSFIPPGSVRENEFKIREFIPRSRITRANSNGRRIPSSAGVPAGIRRRQLHPNPTITDGPQIRPRSGAPSGRHPTKKIDPTRSIPDGPPTKPNPRSPVFRCALLRPIHHSKNPSHKKFPKHLPQRTREALRLRRPHPRNRNRKHRHPPNRANAQAKTTAQAIPRKQRQSSDTKQSPSLF